MADDIGEIHHTGMIFGGTFWDLRKALIARPRRERRHRATEKLYLGALRRSINIPTSLIEALAKTTMTATSSNGTPHECAIRAAFGRHGLRTATGTVIAPGALEQQRARDRHPASRSPGSAIAAPVTKSRARRSTGCPLSACPRRHRRSDAGGARHVLRTAAARAAGSVLLQGDGQVRRRLDDDARRQPRRPVLPALQGETVKLYCTDFETTIRSPTAGRPEPTTATPSPWPWGVADRLARPIRTPRTRARTSSRTVSAADYPPKQRTWVKTPKIDVGQYSDVRLQYRRWLAVEDSHFDQAQITANDKKAWINFTQNKGDSSAIHTSTRSGGSTTSRCRASSAATSVTVGWEIDSRRRPRARWLAARRRLHRRESEFDLRRRREDDDRGL